VAVAGEDGLEGQELVGSIVDEEDAGGVGSGGGDGLDAHRTSRGPKPRSTVPFATTTARRELLGMG
jgi:hypothetical protein